MTNDLEAIEKETNLFPGKVFIRGNENDLYEVTPYSGDKLYDKTSMNFHICPADETLRSSLIYKYLDMREKLKKAFEGYFQEIEMEYTFIKSGTNRMKLPEGYKPDFDIIFLFWGFGSGGNDRAHNVYRFLTFFYKGFWYRINFMRMYLDGKKINCHMNELQYDKDTSNTGYWLNKDKKGAFAICYPPSCHDGDIGKNSAGNVVYNPVDVCYDDIENDPTKVVNSFLSFVAENSKDENVPV